MRQKIIAATLVCFFSVLSSSYAQTLTAGKVTAELNRMFISARKNCRN